jgi:predicted MPP superfamily phosphohydrolase
MRRVRNAVFLAMGLALVFTAFDVRLITTSYTVKSAKIASPVKLAVISDLHSCYYGRGQKTIVDALDAAGPDLLLFVGDICDDVRPNANTETLLKAVAGKYPCYYVTGNHEIWSGEVDSIKEMFRSYGVKVPSGEADIVSVRGQEINICGVDDPDIARYEADAAPFGEQLENVAKATDNGKFTVLMSHRPERAEDYSRYGFDLTVSGHAHGGQWRLFGLNVGLIAPNQGFFPKYTSGVYSLGDSKLIVSRGLARESTRVPRIYNRPEIVIVTLEGE